MNVIVDYIIAIISVLLYSSNLLAASQQIRQVVSLEYITYISFNHGNIQYLDISYNPYFSNEVDFVPEKIDTILREGIANNKPLEEVGRLKSISSINYRNDNTKQQR